MKIKWTIGDFFFKFDLVLLKDWIIKDYPKSHPIMNKYKKETGKTSKELDIENCKGNEG